jgi:hypothetical protein
MIEGWRQHRREFCLGLVGLRDGPQLRHSDTACACSRCWPYSPARASQVAASSGHLVLLGCPQGVAQAQTSPQCLVEANIGEEAVLANLRERDLRGIESCCWASITS